MIQDIFPYRLDMAYCGTATALHLSRWYEGNRYCGRCGGRMEGKYGQRTLACPECGNTVYPGIAGYTARLDGPDGIRLDRKELAAAEWHPRTRLPDELTDISIAYEMIEALRL